MTIKDLPAALRPREKLLAHGAAALRDDAHAALAGFGKSARRLREIADWIALRTH